MIYSIRLVNADRNPEERTSDGITQAGFQPKVSRNIRLWGFQLVKVQLPIRLNKVRLLLASILTSRGFRNRSSLIPIRKLACFAVAPVEPKHSTVHSSFFMGLLKS